MLEKARAGNSAALICMTMRLATAEWADPELVEKKYLYREGSVWLGRSPGADLPMGYRDDRHVCLVSGNRGGKGTTSIINTLCLWPGSAVVIDPKGENATITAQTRGTGTDHGERGLGQSVHVLDPFSAAQIDDSLRSRFNPLDALSPDNEETIQEALRVANAIVVVREDASDPFWDDSARSMVYALILHILTAEEYEGRRNLVTLRKLILAGDREAVEALQQNGEENIGSSQQLLWTGVRVNPAFNGLVADLGQGFSDMLGSNARGFDGVLQTVNRNTEFIDSPAMQRCLEASDFKLEELKTRPEGMSLYLSLPQRYMSTHFRWLRMMIALTVTEMEKVPGRPAVGYSVLLLLDEFAGLKRMEVIETAVSQIAGYGVKLFFVLQSLEQLKAVYKDKWETFLANAGVKIFFNLEDHFSREYVSKLIGETEITRDVHSASATSGTSESLSKTASRSQSESTGHSDSRGKSLSEGTNWSTADSQSKGVSHSTGGSLGGSNSASWKPGLFNLWAFRREETVSSSLSYSDSTSDGTSEGWSRSQTTGGSRGSSTSFSEGTSLTEGSSIGESEGTTTGNSQSRTTSESETLHRRRLIYPDEIGQVFSSVQDRNRAAYPGLELILIAGEKPIYLRRVNYFEDDDFVGLFSRHPDHAFSPRSIYRISAASVAQYKALIPELSVNWYVRAGDAIRAGDNIGEVYTRECPIARVIAPVSGRIRRTLWDLEHPDELSVICAKGETNFVLSTLYPSNGLSSRPGQFSIDPFGELAAYSRKLALQEPIVETHKLAPFPHPADKRPNPVDPLNPLSKWMLPPPTPFDTKSEVESRHPAVKKPNLPDPLARLDNRPKSTKGFLARVVDRVFGRFF
jgi:type IV secretory pathway TraG/TraD family ATPase VirD4